MVINSTTVWEAIHEHYGPGKYSPLLLPTVRVTRLLALISYETILSEAQYGEGNGTPLQCSCLENPRGGRA